MTATLRQIVILLTLFFLIPFGLSAQESISDDTPLLANADIEQPPTSRPKYPFRKKQKEEIPDYYRHHKKLPSNYEGYAIELTTSALPLKRNYFLFDQFGNVFYDKLEEGGYSYCILANFSSKKSVERFLELIILPKATEARLLEFKKGKRKYL
jgi:hypothetical protein